MCSDLIIKVTNLSKCFQIYDKPRDRLKQMFFGKDRKYYREFWALNDISFDIKKGETVGILGKNGSGKSTLLQIICGTLNQSAGFVEAHGRIAALLELGSGFNPEFTGRENVYMNCALLGMSRAEIDERFNEIATFADIGEFIEQPVKTYSSGMFVRLAFAINIISQPEIMIVDEALAVGDMNFQAKCMTALTRLQDNGSTVVFVSHDIGAVKSLCSKGIYLESGTLKCIGDASEVAELYIRDMRQSMNPEQRKFIRQSREFEGSRVIRDEDKNYPTSDLIEEFSDKVSSFRYGSGGRFVEYVSFQDEDGNPVNTIEFNQKIIIKIYLHVAFNASISVNFQIFDDKKNNITGSGFLHAGNRLLRVVEGEKYCIEYALKLPLQEGAYSLSVQVIEPKIPDESSEFVDVVPDAAVFSVGRRVDSRIWSKVYLFPELNIEQIK